MKIYQTSVLTVLCFASTNVIAVEPKGTNFRNERKQEKKIRKLGGKGKGGGGKGAPDFQVFQTTSTFYESQPRNYAEVEEFCDAKGMRLCTLEELCPNRPDYPSRLAFRGIGPDWPMTGTDQWVAYRRESDTKDGCVIGETNFCNFLAPNYWVQVGTSGVHNVCQSHCENDITMECPEWGIDSKPPATYQSFVICC